MSVAEKNREIRKILKSSYPKTKFSVTKRWNYCSNINWTDGPTEKDVKSIVSRYEDVWIDRRFSDNTKTITKHYISSVYGTLEDSEINRLAYNKYSEYSIDENYSIEFLKSEDEKERTQKEKEYQEYLVQKEIDDARYKRFEARRILAREKFDSCEYEVKDIENEDTIVTTAKFAKLNKNQTIAQYEKEVAEDNYYTPRCLVKRVVEFKDWYAWTYFKNQLLDNYDFCAKFGGSKLLETDPRVNESIEDIYKNPELLSYWKANSYDIVIEVKYGNETLYVNPEGYNYPRYVGI